MHILAFIRKRRAPSVSSEHELLPRIVSNPQPALPLEWGAGSLMMVDRPIRSNADGCHCLRGPSKRNLVVCIDGTAKQVTSFAPSTVVEFCRRLTGCDEQLTYYDSGVGTFVKSSHFFRRLRQFVAHSWDKAVAWNLKKSILRAYLWLSENYRPGDRIFLFGYSRGAYQVRVLSGMVQSVGLLHKGNVSQIPFAYELYRSVASGSAKNLKACNFFKTALCHSNVNIHFVGTWDTVSSVGIWWSSSLPETTTGMKHVCAFRHALALDEWRVKFLPEYANGGLGPPTNEGDVKEVWFAGYHSEVGRGHDVSRQVKTYGPALRWMLYEAIDHGLLIEPYFDGVWGNGGSFKKRRRINPLWTIPEYLPIRQRHFKGDGSTSTIHTWSPHRRQGRLVRLGQRTHSTVVDLIRDSDQSEDYLFAYATRARVELEGQLWVKMDQAIVDRLQVEVDLFQTAISRLQDLKVKVSKGVGLSDSINSLNTLLLSRSGQQAMFDCIESPDILLDALQYRIGAVGDLANVDDESRSEIESLIAALATFPYVSDQVRQFSPSTLRVWLRLTSQSRREKIIRNFGYGAYKTLRVDASQSPDFTRSDLWIRSIAYTSDGRFIVSGTDVGIQLWDLQSDEQTSRQLIHQNSATSVASCGNLVASGSWDGTIQIWNMGTSQLQTINPSLGIDPDDPIAVLSIAFSSDGRFIVSGSEDSTIRIWNAGTMGLIGTIPVRTDMGQSADGTLCLSVARDRIVSGSWNGIIRTWKMSTRAAEKVLPGHKDTVRSVALSSNAERIVSGSDDGTVRIWDASTGSPIFILRGHEDYVRSVAFSLDGRRIVSASDDRTVRLWDASTGAPVGQPWRGHEDWVRSVAFSPDGIHCASGSDDETVKVWENQETPISTSRLSSNLSMIRDYII